MTLQVKDTLQRQRAVFVYEWIQAWQDKGWETRIVALIKKLPVALRTQGLSFTLATLVSKDPKKKQPIERTELACVLARWILKEAPQKPFEGQQLSETADPIQLLESCIKADRASYLAAQYEALMLMEELKVMAQALLKERSA